MRKGEVEGNLQKENEGVLESLEIAVNIEKMRAAEQCKNDKNSILCTSSTLKRMIRACVNDNIRVSVALDQKVFIYNQCMATKMVPIDQTTPIGVM